MKKMFANSESVFGNKKRMILITIIFFFCVQSDYAGAAYPSQCTGGQSSGEQTGCTHDNDDEILNSQCRAVYQDAGCTNMQTYLNAMSADCNKKKPSGIDCDMIAKNGYYGREAAKYAAFDSKAGSEKSKTVTEKPAASTPSGCGASTSVGGVTTFANPLCYDSLSEVLVAILVNLQSFLAIIAIIVIVIGGMMYMLSAGNETMITRAKDTIGGALIGLAVILAAPSFLKQIKSVLGGSLKGGNPDQLINNAYTFKDIAISVMNFLLSIIGILGIIALVIGGIMYVTAYGNEDRIESGKKIITNALIGILIAFGALILVKQIAALLGAG